MTQNHPPQAPPWHVIVPCVFVGVVLTAVGLFSSYPLLIVGAILIAFAPLGYAILEISRHPPRPPQRRYDPYADDFERLIERVGKRGKRDRQPSDST